MENVTELVEKAGLTRAEVARAVGVSPAMLRNYERGIYAIPEARLAILQALAGGKIKPSHERAPAAPSLALVPAAELIQELNRRIAAGQLRDTITRPGSASRPVPGSGGRLRAVKPDKD